jgi:hypothetical protein
MARTNIFRSLGTGALLLGLASLGAACNGRVISLGNTGDTLQPLTGGTVKAAAAPVSCPAGWAHPNICCTASASAAPACGAWEENPFHACVAGATTYPDPLSCCSLSDPKNCVDSPSVPVTTAPPPPWGCGYACPPGWWEESAGSAGPTCCEATAGGAPACVAISGGPTLAPPTECGTSGSSSGVVGSSSGASGSSSGASGSSSGGTNGAGSGSSGGGTNGAGSGSSSGGTFVDDAGPSQPDDAGIGVPVVDDAGCGETAPVYTGYDGGTASLCSACPAGWTQDAVQPELCCQAESDGTRLCFSQATGSATSVNGGTTEPGPPDASTPPPSGGGWGSGGGVGPEGGPGVSCSGSDYTCACNDSVGGHAYKLDCSAAQAGGPATCTCLVEGVSVGTASVTSCQDSSAVPNAFSASSGCGFP